MNAVYNSLINEFQNISYSFIHGDLTLSNLVIDREKRLYLIDPRGKFGETDFFGDPNYDIAKLYYSFIGGFDLLNYGKFIVESTSKRYFYKIDNKDLAKKRKLFQRVFAYNDDLINYIHSTIWLSLMPHLETATEKLFAYLYGLNLLNKQNEK